MKLRLWIRVAVPGMEDQNVAVGLAGALRGANLLLNGQEVAREKGIFMLRSNAGLPLQLKLKGRFLDPIANVVVGEKSIEPAPPLAWHQYVWLGLPIGLVFVGGALGGLCGGVAAEINSRIFRSDRNEGAKYVLTGLALRRSLRPL